MRLKYRPLALTGFTVLAVLFISIFVDGRASIASIAGGAVLSIACTVFKKLRVEYYLFFLAAALFLGGFLFTIKNDYGLEYAEKFTEKDSAAVRGTITDFPEYSDSRYYYEIETASIDSEPLKVRLRLSVPSELDAEPYDEITADLKLYMIGRTAGEDIERYFNSKQIFLGAYCKASVSESFNIVKTDNKPLNYRILLLRDTFEKRILEKLPNEYGGTAVALLLGDKSFVSDETKDKIYEAGIAPIFAVSGLHLSVWVMGFYEILRQLKVRKRINSAVNIGFTIFFMALTGFSPSVCRSGLMMILFLSGNLFYRKTDSLNSLGFSALVLCCLNPFIAADTGFLMSFSATLGIVSLMPLLDRFVLKKIRFGLLRAIASAVFVSIAAIAGSFPVTVFTFGYISIFTVISNLLVTYAATLCMVMAGLTAVLFKFSIYSDMAAVITGYLAKYILFVIDKIDDFPVTSISTSDIFWKAGVIFCLAVLAFSLKFFRGRKSARFICIGMSAVIIVSYVSSVIYYNGLTDVRILNVGDGVCVSVTSEGRKILLKGETDGYNSIYTIEDELVRINRRDTNLLLISDEACAESDLTLNLLKSNDFLKVVMPCRSAAVEQLTDSESIMTADDAEINVWNGGNIHFLYSEDISYSFCEFDSVSFLIIYRAEKGCTVLEEYCDADFLVCGGYIPENIDTASFRAVFISSTKKKADNIKSYVYQKGGRAFSVCDENELSVKIRNGEYKINI